MVYDIQILGEIGMRKLLLCLAMASASLPGIATADEAPERWGPTLIGGVPAKPEDWPASVYARANGLLGNHRW